MRPSKSVQDMELSSLRKKFKDKKFAAGCSRETITQEPNSWLGAQRPTGAHPPGHEGLRDGHRSPVRRPLRSTKKRPCPPGGDTVFLSGVGGLGGDARPLLGDVQCVVADALKVGKQLGENDARLV